MFIGSVRRLAFQRCTKVQLILQKKSEIRDSVTKPDDTVISCLRDASKVFGVTLRLLLLCELWCAFCLWGDLGSREMLYCTVWGTCMGCDLVLLQGFEWIFHVLCYCKFFVRMCFYFGYWVYDFKGILLLFYIFMYKCFVFVICSRKKIWSVVILIFVKLCTFACRFCTLVVSLLLLRHYYVMSRSLDVKENVFSSVRLVAVLWVDAWR